MKRFLVGVFTLLLCLVFLPSDVHATVGKSGLLAPSTLRTQLNTGPVNGFATRLGTEIQDHRIHLVKGRYRYASQGGASVLLPSVFGFPLMDEDNQEADLPNGALIRQVTVEVLTTPAASTVYLYSTPKFALSVNSSGDLLAPTAVASLTGRVAGIPVGTAATMLKVPGGASGHSALQVGISGGSVTSGSFNVFVEYYLSD